MAKTTIFRKGRIVRSQLSPNEAAMYDKAFQLTCDIVSTWKALSDNPVTPPRMLSTLEQTMMVLSEHTNRLEELSKWRNERAG